MTLHYVYGEYTPDAAALKKRLRVQEDLDEEFEEILAECLKIAAPKGVFAQCDVSQEGGLTAIGGHRFKSKVLGVNFAGHDYAYPYVITCGRELYDLARSKDDVLERFWVDGISEDALRQVGVKLRKSIRDTYGLGPISSVNPGSLMDFPLYCQRPLFSMLGEGTAAIGVELTDSFLMLPYKSGSGICFESEHSYENCALCPRLDCPGRRKPYDEALVKKYGLTQNAQASHGANCT